MKHIILITLFAFTGISAHAKKNCTDQPKDKWMKEEDFKKKVVGMGYKISKFKQPGSCYEIYGHNKDGKKSKFISIQWMHRSQKKKLISNLKGLDNLTRLSQIHIQSMSGNPDISDYFQFSGESAGQTRLC